MWTTPCPLPPPGTALRVRRDVGHQPAQTCMCEVTLPHPAPALGSDSARRQRTRAPRQCGRRRAGTHTVPLLCPLLPHPPSLPSKSTLGPRPSSVRVTCLQFECAGDAVHTRDNPAPSGGGPFLTCHALVSRERTGYDGADVLRAAVSEGAWIFAVLSPFSSDRSHSVRSSVRPSEYLSERRRWPTR